MTIADDGFGFERDHGSIAAERAFRSLKTVDLEVRPVCHRLAGRVRAHVFLCRLAYYVAWHTRQRLAPILFDDDKQSAEARRASIVAPAQATPVQHRAFDLLGLRPNV